MKKQRNSAKPASWILCLTLVVTLILTIMPISSIKASNLTGTNGMAMEAYMRTNTSTTAGTNWKNYLDGQWLKEVDAFNWSVSGVDSIWIWNGNNSASDVVLPAVTAAGAKPSSPLQVPFIYGSGTKADPYCYEVWSAAQLRYALIQPEISSTAYVSVKVMQDIDLNGNNYAWDTIPLVKNIVLEGQSSQKTIYNLGVLSSSAACGFIYEIASSYFSMSKISWQSACVVSTIDTPLNVGRTSIIGVSTGSAEVSITNVYAKDCLIFSIGDASGTIFGGTQSKNAVTVFDNCGAINCATYGKDHIGNLSSCYDNGTTLSIKNSFAVEGTTVSYGEHSGGFISCAFGKISFENCFTNNYIYGNRYTGVFIGNVGAAFAGSVISFTDCYSSGVIEGTYGLGGFIGVCGNANSSNAVNFTNCYSTSMVGMQNGGTYLGGFTGSIETTTKFQLDNCYTAGEVGSLTTDWTASTGYNGGFTGRISGSRVTGSNCYYDKQMTAMREREVGDAIDGGTGNVSWISGVLTTEKTTGGTTYAGLTNAVGTAGFKGFSDNTRWGYTAGLYPQLAVFTNPTTFNSEYRDLVKAYSMASVQTAYLDVWEKDYSGADLPLTTYDTCRDITSKFPLSNTTSTWNKGIYNADGTYTTATVTLAGGTYQVLTLGAIGSQPYILDFAPGVEWLRVTNTVGNETGSRMLRMVPTFSLDPGNGTTVLVDSKYDHRGLPTATTPYFAYTNAANLAAGKLLFDDTYNVATSTSVILNYADGTAVLANNKIHTFVMDVPAGKLEDGAVIPIAELTTWMLNPEADTGHDISGTDYPALNSKWTGGTSFTSADAGSYFVEYLWEIKDGRYIRNGKVITVKNDSHDVKLLVVDDVSLFDPSISTAHPALTDTTTADSTSALVGADAGLTAAVGTTSAASAAVSVDHNGSATVSWKPVTNAYGMPNSKLSGLSLWYGSDSTQWEQAVLNNDTELGLTTFDYSVIKNTGSGNYDVKGDPIERTYDIVTAADNTQSITFAYTGDIALNNGTSRKFTDIEDDVTILLSFDKIYNTIFIDPQTSLTTPYASNQGIAADGVNTVGAAPTADPSYAKHNFVGWNTSSDGSGDYYSADTVMPDHDVTYYAVYEPIKVTLSFDSAGGSYIPANQLLNMGESGSKPVNPTKNGYSFKGWYYDLNNDGVAETEWNFDDEVNADMTLLAIWAKTPLPNTGDSNDQAIYAALLLLSLSGMTIIYFTGKKRKPVC